MHFFPYVRTVSQITTYCTRRGVDVAFLYIVPIVFLPKGNKMDDAVGYIHIIEYIIPSLTRLGENITDAARHETHLDILHYFGRNSNE